MDKIAVIDPDKMVVAVADLTDDDRVVMDMNSFAELCEALGYDLVR